VASTADFKNGLVLVIDGNLWTIIEFQHVKPGKGPAFVRTKLKNVLSGKVVDKTYNAGVKVETATVDRRDATYLYRDGSDFVFMDSQDYEQHPLAESLVGDAARFLLEGLPVQVAFHNGAPLYLELPVTVELVVTHTEPGLQGDRSSAGTKPATVEAGAELQVPLFINTGDKLKVDSRDGSYLGRVNA
jgi:elongation factor P